MAKQKQEKDGIDEIISKLEKKYGVGRPNKSDLTIVSTGSIQLDQAMRIGGTALGKMIEISGPESSGKSTIMLHQIAEYQKAFPKRRVMLLDFEHSFDPVYASAIGVDVEKLLMYQPDSQEDGYDLVIDFVKSGVISCAVIDSQSAASPKAVNDGEMKDATIALQARNNSKFCLKIKGLLSIHQTTLFFVSQTRDNIGSMGEPVTTTGGRAIKFYADVRWKIWKLNDKSNELNKTTVDIIKSKLGKPFGQAKINIVWGVGFDTIGEIINYAVDFDIMKRAGTWFSYNDSNIGQGLENTKKVMADNPELYEEIYNKVMNILHPKTIEEHELTS